MSRLESGFSTMGFVVLIAGIATAVSAYNVLRSQTVLKASDVKNAGQEAGDMNFNAFNVYQALASGNDPAIFPDPYLPVNGAKMTVGSKAKANTLWDWNQDKIRIYSLSYHGRPQGTRIATEIKSLKLATKDSTRPYLITHADVKANTTVDTNLNKSMRSIDSTASLDLPPPPIPSCSIGFIGTPSTQPFLCVKKPASTQPATDPVTGAPVLDAAGQPVTIAVPATYGGCGAVPQPWSFDTDEGQMVTLQFLANGVVVDAAIQKAAGKTGGLDFAGGPIPRQSQALPYPGANRVEAKNIKLREVSFTATNSSWIELNVKGPSGLPGKCIAGLHVNHGPDKNSEGDSWGGDSRVQMEDGRFQSMATLKAGDRIWNPKLQRPEKILYIHSTAPNSAMMKLSFGSNELHVTAHHPFITARGLVQASDLQVGDVLPAADRSSKILTALTRYRPTDETLVYDVFLLSQSSPTDRMLNVQGLVVPSFEWQRELGSIPVGSATILDTHY